MTAMFIIITSVTLYILILVVMYIRYSKQKFTGSDAAGNGMAKGLTFFYGLGLIFLIAVVFTCINAFFYKNITDTWLRFLFFVPISLPLFIFIFTFLEIGRPRRLGIKTKK